MLFLSFFGGTASAAASSKRVGRSPRAQAELLYQKGLERYAAGRFPEALLAFQEALRRDPESRAARVAAERVRAELAMAGAAREVVAEAPEPEEEPLFERIVRFVEFEDTLGDEREVVGRVKAIQGRIAQLLAEKRLAKACRRRFSKDRELHALSRRLA